MAEMVGHEGCDDTAGSGVPAQGAVEAALPVEAKARAKFERETAALDLSEAEQLSLWSTAMAEQGDASESQRLVDLSARRYESADRHRQTAERLETELGQDA